MTLTIKNAVESFLRNLEMDGKSECSIASYKGTLTRFVALVGEEENLEAIQPLDVDAFKTSLGPVKVTTITLRLEHVKLFFDWAVDMEYLTKNPVKAGMFPNKKNVMSVKNRPIEEKLTVEEALAILDAPRPLNFPAATFPRNKAITALFITGGMRNQELAHLRPCDLNYEDGYITIRHGKGDKFRTVPFPVKAQKMIIDYLRSGYRPAALTDQDPLFGTIPKNAPGTWNVLDRHILSEIVRRFVEAVTEKDKIRSHKLRHAFASVSREMGMAKEDIQECLGHASLETTERYLDRLNPEAAPNRMNAMWDSIA